MKHSRIAGTGRCLPKRIVTNDARHDPADQLEAGAKIR